MRIYHNIPALDTYRHLSATNNKIAKALEKLSSGLRIVRAADDAAGLAISEKMRAQIKGLDQAARNAQDGISLIQTAEGAMDEMHSILQRMRELAVQAASDSYTDFDRQQIQKEVDQLKSEIDRIADTTQFNTKKLLTGNLSYNLLKVAGNATVSNLSADSRVDSGKFQMELYQAADVAKMMGATAFDSSGGTYMHLHTGTITINGVAVHLDSDEYNSASDKLQYIIDKINEKTSQTGVVASKEVDPYNSNIYHLKLTQNDVGTSEQITLGGDEQTLKDIGFGTLEAVEGSSLSLGTTDSIAFGNGLSLFINGVKVLDISTGGTMTIQSIARAINNYAAQTGVRAEAIETGVKWATSTVSAHTWKLRLIQTTPGVNVDLTNTHGDVSLIGFTAADQTANLTTIDPLENGDSGIRWYEGNNETTNSFSSALATNGQIRINGIWIDIGGLNTLVSVAAAINAQSALTNVKAEVVGAEIGGKARLRLYQDNSDPNNKIIMYGNYGTTANNDLDDIGFGYQDQNNIRDFSGEGARYTTGVNVKVRVYSTDETGKHIDINSDNALIIEGQGKTVTLQKVKSGGHVYTPLNYDYTKKSTGLKLDIDGDVTPWYWQDTLTVGTLNVWGSAAEVRVRTDDALFLHVGANEDEVMQVDIKSMNTDSLGLTGVDVTTHATAEIAITTISDAINSVSTERAKLGAFQNRLEHTINNLNVGAENLQAAESRIRDVDMAKEMMTYTKLQILQQSGTAMLAQANALPQSVLQLLR